MSNICNISVTITFSNIVGVLQDCLIVYKKTKVQMWQPQVQMWQPQVQM